MNKPVDLDDLENLMKRAWDLPEARRAVDELRAARVALKEARGALLRYARHDPTCPLGIYGDSKCECGLSKAMTRVVVEPEES